MILRGSYYRPSYEGVVPHPVAVADEVAEAGDATARSSVTSPLAATIFAYAGSWVERGEIGDTAGLRREAPDARIESTLTKWGSWRCHQGPSPDPAFRASAM